LEPKDAAGVCSPAAVLFGVGGVIQFIPIMAVIAIALVMAIARVYVA